MAGSGRQRKRGQANKKSKGVKKQNTEEQAKGRPEKRDACQGHNLIAALNHKLRRRILRFLNDSNKPLSPVNLSELMDAPLSNVSYHMNILRKYRVAAVVDERQVRGAVEHFYVSMVDDHSAVLSMLDETEAKDGDKA